VLSVRSGAETSVGERRVTVSSSSKLGSKFSISKSSDASVSSDSGNDSGGGVGCLDLGFLLYLPFRGIMEFAQDLTLRGLRMAFLDADFGFTVCWAQSPLSTTGEANGDTKLLGRAGSDLLMGSEGTELSLRLDSRRKKLRRFVGTPVELAPAVGEVGDTADIGRFRSAACPLSALLVSMSRTAPAVLGRASSSTVLRVGRPMRVGCEMGLLLPTTEERLFAAE
jgi:hypothetical protein